ncbi:MAG: hypothetical protein SYR96_34475 [Actinomycetota bacterium]|nr:hypothetical protein [Actinomycetota bacterium]
MLNLAVILRESATSRPEAPALLHDAGTILSGTGKVLKRDLV